MNYVHVSISHRCVFEYWHSFCLITLEVNVLQEYCTDRHYTESECKWQIMYWNLLKMKYIVCFNNDTTPLKFRLEWVKCIKRGRKWRKMKNEVIIKVRRNLEYTNSLAEYQRDEYEHHSKNLEAESISILLEVWFCCTCDFWLFVI